MSNRKNTISAPPLSSLMTRAATGAGEMSKIRPTRSFNMGSGASAMTMNAFMGMSGPRR